MGGTCDAVILELPVTLCFQGRVYELRQTGNGGLIMTAAKKLLTGGGLVPENL